jgi:outer membrane receptor protein involved in Fe transport
MNTSSLYRKSLLGALVASQLVFVGSQLTAQVAADQTTPPAQPAKPITVETTPSQGQDVVTLNPFEVASEKDNGYYASNTMAGTRINSKVEDLGASITVVTKQQLIDTASTDINDIFRYESNTEGTYNFTAQLSASPTNDPIQSSPQTAVRVRGVGAPNMLLDNFAMTARIPVNSYNLDSVEISRGPNSTLFGLGNPSGSVGLNRATANLTRNSDSLTLRADSFGGYQASLDVSRVLLKNELAVRFAAINMNNAFTRKPSYDQTKRLYGDLIFKPFKSTRINLNWEHYQENRQTPNYLTPRDDVSEWIADGKPVWNPLTWTATLNGQSFVVPYTSSENNLPGTTGALPVGLYANATNYTRPSMYIDGGQVQLWEINRAASTTNPNAATTSNQRMMAGSGSLIQRGDINAATLYQIPGINNKALYDWTKINAVSPDWNYDHASIYTAVLEQELVPNLYFRAGFHLEASDSFNRNIVNPPVLEIDTNQYLLDGKANPYFLRPFYQTTEPTIFRSPEYNDNTQVQLTYELDFKKLTNNKGLMRFLGDHKMLAYYEGRKITDGTFRYREAIIDPNHAWLTAGSLNYTNGAALDRPTYRYYVGPTGALGYTPGYAAPKSGVQGTFNLNYNNPTTGSWISEPAIFGTSPYVTSQTRQEINSRGLVDQSSFLDDRVVFTGGLRNDYNRSRNSNGAVINGNTGLYDVGPISTWLPWTNSQGYTRTLSLVVKPLSWFGLFADKSASFVPQPPAIDLFDKALPNTYGHGQDMGAYFSLLNNKLVIRISKYKTDVVNNRDSDSTIGSRIMRMETNSLTSADHFSFNYWAVNAAAAKLATSTTDPAAVALANTWTAYPAFLQAAINDYNNGAALRGVDNTESKGVELQVDYNPNYNWSFKFTGAETEAIQTALEADISDFVALRMPTWLAANDGLGNYFWTDTRYTSQTAQNFYSASVSVPIQISQALLGKENPQVKKYTWRTLSSYRFTEGRLKNFSVGGTVRWDDKSVIGYKGAAPGSDGIVRSLDVNKPVYDPARFAGDLHLAYNTKIYAGKVGLRIQFNWVNAFQQSELRPTAVNPDGTPYNFRIIDPQMFVLTNTFTF